MIDHEAFQRYAADPSAYRNNLIVDVDGIARRFGDAQDDWQREDFAALDGSLLQCAGRRPLPTGADVPGRAYLERPRGHSKTTDLAVMCCWALAFATRPLKGYAYAADKDQARLLRDAMATLIRLNPWLGSILSVEAHRIVNKAAAHPGEGGTLAIEASDVGSSYGILPDLIIADELTHWSGNGSLFHSLISSAAKRSNCLLVCISNAGFCDSWQWSVREAARADAGWYFSRLEGPQASWMTPARLDEQRRMLPAVAFARLWLNEWSSGGGDALTEADIDAAFDVSLRPVRRPEAGWDYVAGLDLGVSRDASALIVLGIRNRDPSEPEVADHGRIRLAYHRRWKPSKGQKINLQEIEDALVSLHFQFSFRAVGYDPWEARHMAQRLGLLRLPMVELPPTSANLQRVATTLIEAFADRRLEIFEDADLRRDLRRLRVEERSYGFRLTSPRDEHGHGDSVSAFGSALLVATDLAGKVRQTASAFGIGGASDLSAWEQRLAEFEAERDAFGRDGGNDKQERFLEQFPIFLFRH